jgi:hypothetical protein
VQYVAFADASAGRHDAFTCCIGHVEGEDDAQRFVVDVVRGRQPPFDPNEVAAEYAALAHAYHVRRMVGDAYAGAWVEQAFLTAGIEYIKSELPKSQLYLEGLSSFNTGRVSLPDDAKLIRELRLLERQTHRSGKDSVDHPKGASDDYANVVFGALWLTGIAGMKNRRRGDVGACFTYGGVTRYNAEDDEHPLRRRGAVKPSKTTRILRY